MTNHPNRTKPVPEGTPTPEEIKAARAAAGLTQREAAALIWYEEIAWKQWEGGTRRMHPCAWWAFNARASVLATTMPRKLAAQARAEVAAEPAWVEPPLRDMQPAHAPTMDEYRKLLSIACPLCKRGVGVPCRNPTDDMKGDYDMGPPIDGDEDWAEVISVHAARVVALKGKP